MVSFDLGQAVGDVSWAPYSSTAFAAITSDGIVHFYDLSVNRNERICYQKVSMTRGHDFIVVVVVVVGSAEGKVNAYHV